MNWILSFYQLFFTWAIPGLFFFIFVFSIQLSVNVQYKFLPMTGFEPQTSLPTEPQPLPNFTNCFTNIIIREWLVLSNRPFCHSGYVAASKREAMCSLAFGHWISTFCATQNELDSCKSRVLWPVKNRQKLPKKYFTIKIKAFDTLTKIA